MLDCVAPEVWWGERAYSLRVFNTDHTMRPQGIRHGPSDQSYSQCVKRVWEALKIYALVVVAPYRAHAVLGETSHEILIKDELRVMLTHVR